MANYTGANVRCHYLKGIFCFFSLSHITLSCYDWRHLEESHAVLLDQQTGVRFVPAVRHVHVELIGLGGRTGSCELQSVQLVVSDEETYEGLTQVTKQCPTSSGSCS